MTEIEAHKAATTAATYVKEAALAVSKAIAWYVASAKSASETADEYAEVANSDLKNAVDAANHYDNRNNADYYNQRVKFATKCTVYAAEFVAAAAAAAKAAAVYAEAFDHASYPATKITYVAWCPACHAKIEWDESGTQLTAQTPAELAAENARCNSAYLAKKTE